MVRRSVLVGLFVCLSSAFLVLPTHGFSLTDLFPFGWTSPSPASSSTLADDPFNIQPLHTTPINIAQAHAEYEDGGLRAHAHSSSSHSSRELAYSWSYPLFGDEFLMDQDNKTQVVRGILSTSDPTNKWSWDFTFNPSSEFLLFYVNCSKASVEMSFKFGASQVYTGKDIDLSYLDPAQRIPYQSYAIKPSRAVSICTGAFGSGRPCTVSMTLTLASGSTTNTPFRLSMLQNRMLGWSNEIADSMEANHVSTWGLEITQNDLPVLFRMLPEQEFIQQTDQMLFLGQAENPIQYFTPNPSTFRSRQHAFGGEVAYLLPSQYSSGQISGRTGAQSSAADDASSSSRTSHHAPISFATYDGLAPSEGGNAYADPNFGATQFGSTLYLLIVHAHATSKPISRFTMYAERQYSTESESQWSGSTYGIVGALTLLVLCLISCAVAFMRRRCRGGRSLDDGLFFGGGGVVLTPEQRAALPTTGPDGRPIRYDAHGRVLPDLGAKQEEIDALVQRTFVDGMIPKEDASCTICLGDYESGEKIKDMPCGHIFHSECISKWLIHRRTCPNCNQDLNHAKNVKGMNSNGDAHAHHDEEGGVGGVHREDGPIGSDPSGATEVMPLVGTSPTSPGTGVDTFPRTTNTRWCVDDNNANGSSGGAATPTTNGTSTRITVFDEKDNDVDDVVRDRRHVVSSASSSSSTLPVRPISASASSCGPSMIMLTEYPTHHTAAAAPTTPPTTSSSIAPSNDMRNLTPTQSPTRAGGGGVTVFVRPASANNNNTNNSR